MCSANTSFVDDSLLSSFRRWPLPSIPANGFRRFYSMNGNTKKRRDPHSVAPETSKTVLLLVDVINDFDFPQGEKLLRFALPAARRVAALKTRLRKRGIPAIYVNDNFGRWQSDFKKQVERCISEAAPGSEVARLLYPVRTITLSSSRSIRAFTLRLWKRFFPILARESSSSRDSPRTFVSFSPRTTPTCAISNCWCRAIASPRRQLQRDEPQVSK